MSTQHFALMFVGVFVCKHENVFMPAFCVHVCACVWSVHMCVCVFFFVCVSLSVCSCVWSVGACVLA